MSKIVGYGSPRAPRMQRLGEFNPQLYRSVWVPPATRACEGLGRCGSSVGTDDAATNSQGHGFALGVGVGLVAGVIVGSFLRLA